MVVYSVVPVPRLDHKSMVIDMAPKENCGNRRFRFENARFYDEGLVDVVRSSWCHATPHNLLLKRDNLIKDVSEWGRYRNKEFWQKKKTIQIC